jgi:RIO kinase 1
VDALYRLAAAGVRVPKPYNFHEGVLLMELVTYALLISSQTDQLS